MGVELKLQRTRTRQEKTYKREENVSTRLISLIEGKFASFITFSRYQKVSKDDAKVLHCMASESTNKDYRAMLVVKEYSKSKVTLKLLQKCLVSFLSKVAITKYGSTLYGA
jgi:hypothetical protein